MSAITSIRKTLLAIAVVPALAAGFVTAEPVFNTEATAQAQFARAVQAPQRNYTPGTPGENNKGQYGRYLRPCPPTTTHVSDNCRPWTPPTKQFSSADDCECDIKIRNGKPVKDCYVLINQQVQYCEEQRRKY